MLTFLISYIVGTLYYGTQPSEEMMDEHRDAEGFVLDEVSMSNFNGAVQQIVIKTPHTLWTLREQ